MVVRDINTNGVGDCLGQSGESHNVEALSVISGSRNVIGCICRLAPHLSPSSILASKCGD